MIMTGNGEPIPFQYFRKRDGHLVPFRPEKIAQAVLKAGEAAARQNGEEIDDSVATAIADEVVAQLDNPLCEYYTLPDEDGQRIPQLEDVQDMVEIVMSEHNLSATVAAFKRYRKMRERARAAIQVRDPSASKDKSDLTDQTLLLVQSTTQGDILPWDRTRISTKLIEVLRMDEEAAVSVAKEVENQIIASNMKRVETNLIRAMVNNVLIERGYKNRLEDLSLYQIPREFIENLMYMKPTENSNIVSNNPEAVNLSIAELVLKQWGLDTIFSPEVKEAHDTGAVHLHDLGYPHRVYCSSHSIEYIKKYGLRDLSNLNTESNPARSASVLTGHLNTFLASMQANYAGALGIAYINIFYAPYLVGLTDKEVFQIAQELIFNGSQNAFSRGGQTLFLDFNIHTGVPKYLREVPAIGPGGKYMLRRADGEVVPLEEVLRTDTDAAGNKLMDLYVVEADGSKRLVLREVHTAKDGVHYAAEPEADLKARGEHLMTYGDYIPEARRFTSALLKVWGEGDRNGRVFEFPKCDFHISQETFDDPEQYRIFLEACDLASKNGSTYFVFDRDEVTLSACCRLRTTIDDNRMLKHPESMRFCGFQNVTINIPQASYRAARRGQKTVEGLLEEIDQTMDLAVKAHLQKKAKIAEMMSGPGRPLWQIGKVACDGRPYVELDKATYIIGLIGVNDAVKFITGKEMHESEESFAMALRIVSHMFLRARQYSKQYGLKFTLEESPAESAARRLAKADLIYYPQEATDIVKGPEDAVYYTNSIHLAAEAPVCLVERIEKQAMFHSVIESGAITHAFIGEERPSSAAIAELIQEVFMRTQSAQVTISPEFTYCEKCGHQSRGLQESCQQCGSQEVVGETRVVGYFSKIQNWNKSKRYGELVARQKGRYAVEAAQ